MRAGAAQIETRSCASASREMASRSVAGDGMPRERTGGQVCAQRFRRLVDQVLADLGAEPGVHGRRHHLAQKSQESRGSHDDETIVLVLPARQIESFHDPPREASGLYLAGLRSPLVE